MGKDKGSNGWNEYQKLVLANQDRDDKAIGDIARQLSDFKVDTSKELSNVSRDMSGVKASLANIRKTEDAIAENAKEIVAVKTDVARLQVKSGLWGTVGGILAMLTLMLASWIQGNIEHFLTFFKKN